jgi:OOP family OmpA-OmpF porin
MANSSYSWSDVRGVRSYSLPGPEHLGWWAAAAMVVSVLLHVLVFFTLDHLKIAFGLERDRELSTGPVAVRQVEVMPMDYAEELPPVELVEPVEELLPMMEEIDLFEHLPPDSEIDMSPEMLEPQFDLELANPALEGDPQALTLDVGSGFNFDSDLPDLGKTEEIFPAAAVGQITVDPGAMPAAVVNLEEFTEDLLKKGAAGKIESEALDGLASMDEMMGLPADVLVGKRTLLPSDLLFEFNSAELRESAKIGLMKLGLLIDLNPDLHCWIEGHTDLVGSERYNLDLSQRRAAAVKSYLVHSMRMEPGKIHSRGMGKAMPLIMEGDAEAQAPNRRVEIRMRKTPPPPQKSADLAPADAPPAPRAVLVRPNRALSEEEMAPAPRAVAVEESEIPRATAVDESDTGEVPPKAMEVKDDPPAPRAIPVDEE